MFVTLFDSTGRYLVKYETFCNVMLTVIVIETTSYLMEAFVYSQIVTVDSR